MSQTLGERVRAYLGIEEDEPESVSVRDYFKGSGKAVGPFVKDYVHRLFPFVDWLPRYNLTWLTGDLIAGITVGLVLVPQSLSYAKLADLPTQYGLYSSFIGVLTYALFATSKDVSIGPVAVLSTVTGNVLTSVLASHTEWTAPEIATALAFICGFIVLAIGLFRVGWIIEFIPQPAVSGYMTGSALNIAAGQIPGLLGTSKLFNTKAATYQVIINTLKYLPQSDLDAAFGVSSLALLYGIKWSMDWVQRRYPGRRARIAFFIQALRHGFVVILFTIISWRVNVNHKTARILLVGTVPSGLQEVHTPLISKSLLAAIGPHIPVTTIVMLLEHISIAKSFGRLNGYKIDPNQELVAIGVNNVVGSCFSAYPSTGSFSRSALKSKSGVRTPLAGVATGIVVIVALYAVAPAFYWIPNASLAALIIHAVADLVASPKQSFGFWRVSPVEYIIFVGAVLWSIFYSIESGIYWSLATSVVLLLFRMARPKGNFLGRVRIQPEGGKTASPGAHSHAREVYVPIGNNNGVLNRDIDVEAPPPGIIVYRFEESFLYPNASYINDRLVDRVKAETRRGKDYSGISAGDRPWNDPGPKQKDAAALYEAERARPLLRAIILDFSAVANIDTTGVQNLIDTRKAVERWADRPVEFHFAGILSPWIRRALIAGGFGRGQPRGTALEVAPVVPGYAGDNFADPAMRAEIAHAREEPDEEVASGADSEEKGIAGSRSSDCSTPRRNSFSGSIPLLDRATPFFHFDIPEALSSVERGTQTR
ncbi:Sulfate permease 2 [Cryptotrichosporon argae]